MSNIGVTTSSAQFWKEPKLNVLDVVGNQERQEPHMNIARLNMNTCAVAYPNSANEDMAPGRTGQSNIQTYHKKLVLRHLTMFLNHPVQSLRPVNARKWPLGVNFILSHYVIALGTMSSNKMSCHPHRVLALYKIRYD